ncbi:MAG: hypothetical protein IPG39_19345 [Bacteroidetes bacterium]|nr:hypothetical protein [Bacteroidota bacterium]
MPDSNIPPVVCRCLKYTITAPVETIEEVISGTDFWDPFILPPSGFEYDIQSPELTVTVLKLHLRFPEAYWACGPEHLYRPFTEVKILKQ